MESSSVTKSRKNNLTEKILKIDVGRLTPFPVILHINLTPKELFRKMENGPMKNLRGLIVDHDVYWWEGHEAIHYDIAQSLHTDKQKENNLELFWSKHPKIGIYIQHYQNQNHPIIERLIKHGATDRPLKMVM